MRKPLPLPFAPALEALMTRLIARYASGRPTLSPDEIGEIAWGVSTLWEGFTGKRDLAGESYLARPELLHAYMLYYLPRSYVQARLAFRHLEGKPISRVLDLGSGPGPLLLAAQDAFHIARGAGLTAVDHDARALKLADELTGARTFVSKLPQLPPAISKERFDVVSLGLVINELFKGAPDAVARRAAWLTESVWPLVVDGGHLVIVEPALRETGREALQLRDALVGAGLRVIAPCTRQGNCPALEKDRDWCHAGLRFQPPRALEAIGRAVGIDPTDVRFTYLIFEKAPAPAAEPPELLRVVSELMVEKGRMKIWVCGPRGRVLLDRQDKHRTEANALLDVLQRDDLLTVRGAEEKPGNLRVLETTAVERPQRATEARAAPP